MERVIGTLMMRPSDGDAALVRRAGSKAEIRKMVASGYRPIGPAGWRALRSGGFLPRDESYLAKFVRHEDEADA